ncbi:MAG: hypothetical protein AB1529_02190 [Candidatus Micrarchaeota archaeon]
MGQKPAERQPEVRDEGVRVAQPQVPMVPREQPRGGANEAAANAATGLGVMGKFAAVLDFIIADPSRAEGRLAEFSRRLEPYRADYPEETRIALGLFGAASRMYREAQDARAHGDTQRAQELEDSARAHFREGMAKAGSVPGMAQDIHSLAGAGASPEWIESRKAAFNDVGLGTWNRAIAIDQAVEWRVKNDAIIDAGGPAAREAEARMRDEAVRLAEGSRQGQAFSEQDYQDTMRRFSEASAPVTALAAHIHGAAALFHQAAMRQGVSEQYTKAMEDLKKEFDKLLKKLEEGTATKEDVEKAKELADAVKAAETDLEGLSGDDAVTVSGIHARGLSALRQGKGEMARVQRQLAREYAKTKDPGMRKKLERWSADLAKGKAPEAELERWLEAQRPAEFRALTTENIKRETAERAGLLREKGYERSHPRETKRIAELDREAAKALEEAKALRKRGDLDGAGKLEAKAFRLLREARAKVLWLERLDRFQARLAGIKEPPEMKKAAEEVSKALGGAFNFIGTQDGWRARLAFIAADVFIRYGKVLQSKPAAPLLKGILSIVGILSDPRKKVDEKRAQEEVGRLEPKALSAELGGLKGKVDDKAHSKLTDAVKAASGFIGTNQQWRAAYLLRGVKFFLDNREKIGTRGKLFEGIMGFLGRLADPKGEIGEEEAKREFARITGIPAEAPAQAGGRREAALTVAGLKQAGEGFEKRLRAIPGHEEQVRSITETVKLAGEEFRAGNVKKAQELLALAEKKAAALEGVVEREKRIDASGAPEEAREKLKKAGLAAFNDLGKQSGGRFDTVVKATDLFLGGMERKLWLQPGGETAALKLLDFIGRLGEGALQGLEFDSQAAESELSDISAQAGELWKAMLGASITEWLRLIEGWRTMGGLGTANAKFLDDLAESYRALQKRLEEGAKAEDIEQEASALEARAEHAKKIGEELEERERAVAVFRGDVEDFKADTAAFRASERFKKYAADAEPYVKKAEEWEEKAATFMAEAEKLEGDAKAEMIKRAADAVKRSEELLGHAGKIIGLREAGASDEVVSAYRKAANSYIAVFEPAPPGLAGEAQIFPDDVLAYAAIVFSAADSYLFFRKHGRAEAEKRAERLVLGTTFASRIADAEAELRGLDGEMEYAEAIDSDTAARKQKLMDSATELRGDKRKVPKPREGSAEWYGQMALDALERGDFAVADLAVYRGMFEKVAPGGGRNYVPEDIERDISAVLRGEKVPAAGELDRYLTLIDSASLTAQADLLKRDNPVSGSAEERERKQRVHKLAEEIKRRADAHDFAGAERLLEMATVYTGLARDKKWKAFAGADRMEAALDAELAGGDHSGEFQAAVVYQKASEETASFRASLADWGAGLAENKKLVERGLLRVEQLVSEGKTEEAGALFGQLMLYAGAVRTFAAPKKRDVIPGFDPAYDSSKLGGMGLALDALIKGEAEVGGKKPEEVFSQSFLETQREYLNKRADAYLRLSEKMPVGAETVGQGLAEVRRRAAEGDFEGALRLLEMAGNYYGEAAPGKQAGWRYRDATRKGPGYERGRQDMLNAISMEIAAKDPADHDEALETFNSGSQRISVAKAAIERYEIVERNIYNALPTAVIDEWDHHGTIALRGEPTPENEEGPVLGRVSMEKIRRYESEHPDDTALGGGLSLKTLLTKMKKAAEEGDDEAFRKYEKAFFSRLYLVAGRILRREQLEENRQEVKKYIEVLEGFTAAITIDQLVPYGWLEGDDERLKKVTALEKQLKNNEISKAEFESKLNVILSERLQMIEQNKFTDKVPGPMRETVRQLAPRAKALLERARGLYGKLEKMDNNSSEFPLEEYKQVVKDLSALTEEYQTQRKISVAYSHIDQQLQMNKSYHEAIAGEGALASDYPDAYGRAVKFLGFSNGHFKKAQELLLKGEFKQAGAEFERGINRREWALMEADPNVLFGQANTYLGNLPISMLTGVPIIPESTTAMDEVSMIKHRPGWGVLKLAARGRGEDPYKYTYGWAKQQMENDQDVNLGNPARPDYVKDPQQSWAYYNYSPITEYGADFMGYEELGGRLWNSVLEGDGRKVQRYQKQMLVMEASVFYIPVDTFIDGINSKITYKDWQKRIHFQAMYNGDLAYDELFGDWGLMDARTGAKIAEGVGMFALSIATMGLGSVGFVVGGGKMLWDAIDGIQKDLAKYGEVTTMSWVNLGLTVVGLGASAAAGRLVKASQTAIEAAKLGDAAKFTTQVARAGRFATAARVVAYTDITVNVIGMVPQFYYGIKLMAEGKYAEGTQQLAFGAFSAFMAYHGGVQQLRGMRGLKTEIAKMGALREAHAKAPEVFASLSTPEGMFSFLQRVRARDPVSLVIYDNLPKPQRILFDGMLADRNVVSALKKNDIGLARGAFDSGLETFKQLSDLGGTRALTDAAHLGTQAGLEPFMRDLLIPESATGPQRTRRDAAYARLGEMKKRPETAEAAATIETLLKDKDVQKGNETGVLKIGWAADEIRSQQMQTINRYTDSVVSGEQARLGLYSSEGEAARANAKRIGDSYLAYARARSEGKPFDWDYHAKRMGMGPEDAKKLFAKLDAVPDARTVAGVISREGVRQAVRNRVALDGRAILGDTPLTELAGEGALFSRWGELTPEDLFGMALNRRERAAEELEGAGRETDGRLAAAKRERATALSREADALDAEVKRRQAPEEVLTPDSLRSGAKEKFGRAQRLRSEGRDEEAFALESEARRSIALAADLEKFGEYGIVRATPDGQFIHRDFPDRRFTRAELDDAAILVRAIRKRGVPTDKRLLAIYDALPKEVKKDYRGGEDALMKSVLDVIYSRRGQAAEAAAPVLRSEELPVPSDPALAAVAGMTVPGTNLRWGVIPPDQVLQWQAKVYEAYKAAYGKIGLIYDSPEAMFAKNPEVLVATDGEGRIVAFTILKKTAFGTKLSLVGAVPDIPEGRAAARAMIQGFPALEGAYITAPGAPAHLAIKAGVPVVPYDSARIIQGEVPAEAGSPGAYQNGEGKWVRQEAQRGDGPEGMAAISRMPGFADSELVKHAIAQDGVKPGAKPEELTWNDLVEQAVKMGELPDRPEVRQNAFAVPMVINGKPEIVVKVMFGKPPADALEVRSVLQSRGIGGQVAADAINLYKIFNGEQVPLEVASRYMDVTLHDQYTRIKQEKIASGMPETKADAEALVEVAKSMAPRAGEGGLEAGGPISQEGVELLRMAEGKLDLVEGLTGADVAKATLDWSQPRLEMLRILTVEGSPYRERFLAADPAERAVIADAIARGATPERAFLKAAEGMVPADGRKLLEVGERLKGLPEAERNLRLRDLESLNPALGRMLKRLADPATPETVKQEIAAEWDSAVAGAERHKRVNEARAARDAAQLAEQELALLKGTPDEQAAGRVPAWIESAAKARGKDPAALHEALVKAYGEGGTEGRLRVLNELGALGGMPEGVRSTFVQNSPEFFELIVRGGLEGRVAAMPGFEGGIIVNAEKLEGLRGAYKIDVEMPDGSKRSLFVKAEDLVPAQLGSELAGGHGLLPPVIHAADGQGMPFTYDTGIRYTDPVSGQETAHMQEFGIMEDVHDYATARHSDVIMLPDGRSAQVTVESVAVVSREVFADPARMQAILADEHHPAHKVVKAFWELAKTEEGRQRIFQAWRAYHELSRRAMLLDRFDRNTVAVLVTTPEGESVLTFQPIDMDYVAGKIGSDGDLRFFNDDFASASVDFATKIAGAAGVPAETVLGEMAKAYGSDSVFPREAADERAAAAASVRATLNKYDGKPFGAGYDVEDYGKTIGKDYVEYGGRDRIVGRRDGRAILHAGDITPLGERIGGAEAEADFSRFNREKFERMAKPLEEAAPPPAVEAQPPAGEKTPPGKRGAGNVTPPARPGAMRGAPAGGPRTVPGKRGAGGGEPVAAPGGRRKVAIGGGEVELEPAPERAPELAAMKISEDELSQLGVSYQGLYQDGAGRRLNVFETEAGGERRLVAIPADLSGKAMLDAIGAEVRALGRPTELPPELRGMPPDVSSQVGMDGAPKARLLSSEPLGRGSSADVYLAEMVIDGRPTRVAVKIYKNPEGNGTWQERAEYFADEVRKAKILGDAGLGPKVFGIADAGGNMAFAMEVIEGKPMYIDEMAPGLRAKYINEDTFAQVRKMYDELIAHGYEIGDFDFMILTEGPNAGRVVFLDAGALREVPRGAQGEPRPRYGDGAKRAEGGRLQAEAMTAMEYFTKMDRDELAAVAEVSKGLLGQGHVDSDTMRLLAVRWGSREGRARAIGEYITSIAGADEQKAKATFDALKRIEAETGIRLLPDGARFEDLAARAGEGEISEAEIIAPMSGDDYHAALAGMRTQAARESVALHFSGRGEIPDAATFENAAILADEAAGAKVPEQGQAELSVYYDGNGRIIGIADNERLFYGDPKAINDKTPEAKVRVDLESGRIVSMDERGMKNPLLADLVGLRILPGKGAEGAGPGGRGPPPLPPMKVLDEGSIVSAYASGTGQAQRTRAARSFVMLDGEGQGRVISELRSQGRHEEARHLTELQAIGGEAGAGIERVYGIPRDEIITIYAREPTAQGARKALAERLGIVILPFEWEHYPADRRQWVSVPYRDFRSFEDDHFLFGLITSGNMIDTVSQMYPGGRIASIEYHNGAIGAYEVAIRTQNGETRTVFVKRQDLRPDAAGSDYSVRSGVPAPEVITSAGGRELTYVGPDGEVSRYGIITNMRDFGGMMRFGGVEAQVRATDETALWDLDRSPLAGSLMSQDPQVRAKFWEELGYMLAGSYATGIWDRHAGNARAMVLEVQNADAHTNPADQSSPTVGEALSQKGYWVWQQDGKTYMFMIGGIDTDTAANYLAGEAHGSFDMTGMNIRYGYVDLHSLFNRLATIRGTSVDALVMEAFGDVSGGQVPGPVAMGMKRWWRDFGSDPHYADEMAGRFSSHEGESIGFGYPRTEQELDVIRQGGVLHQENPQNGDPYTIIAFADGRSRMRPEYEIVHREDIEALDPRIAAMFPPGRDMYAVEITGEVRKAVPDIDKRTNRIRTSDGRMVAIIDSADPLAKTLLDGGIPMVKARRDMPRQGEVAVDDATGIIRAAPGFGKLTGIQAYQAGPVPVFRAMMGAGEGFMLGQFAHIGHYILAKETSVREAAQVPAGVVAGEIEAPGIERMPAPAQVEGVRGGMRDLVGAVRSGDEGRIRAAEAEYDKRLGVLARLRPDTELRVVENETLFADLAPGGQAQAKVLAADYLRNRSAGKKLDGDLLVIDYLVSHGMNAVDAAAAVVNLGGAGKAPAPVTLPPYVAEHFGTRQPDPVTAENALILAGDRNTLGRLGIPDGLGRVLKSEGMAVVSEGKRMTEVRGYYDLESGRIIYLGRTDAPREVTAGGVEFVLRFDHESGRVSIPESEDVPLPDSIARLNGMRIAPPPQAVPFGVFGIFMPLFKYFRKPPAAAPQPEAVPIKVPRSRNDIQGRAEGIRGLPPDQQAQELAGLHDAVAAEHGDVYARNYRDMMEELVKHPEHSGRILDEWEAVRAEEKHYEALERARRYAFSAAEGFGIVRGQDRKLISGGEYAADMARSRGEKPKAFRKRLLEAYDAGFRRGGVLDARLGVANSLGVLDNIVVESRPGVLDEKRTMQARKEFIRKNPEFFDLIMRGGLEEVISANLGAGDVRIAGVSHAGGMARGAYGVEVLLPDGRRKRVFVKLEDLGPAAFGADLARVEGMIAPKVFTADSQGRPLSYDVSYKDPIGKRMVSGQRRFGIMLDVRDTVGQKARVRTADGRFREITVTSVALVGDDIFNARSLDGIPQPSRAAAEDFWTAMGSEGGREEMFRTWYAYQEMSRRATLSDRHTGNSMYVIGVTSDGETVRTFQPIDPDDIGAKVEARPEGMNFSEFNDFSALYTSNFVNGLYLASDNAASLGLLKSPINRAQASRAASSDAAMSGWRLPEDPGWVRSAAEFIIMDYDGKPFGLGTDMTIGGHGSYIKYHAGRRRAAGYDGRVRMYSDEMLAVYRGAQDPANAADVARRVDERMGWENAGHMRALERRYPDLGTLPPHMQEYREPLERARRRIAGGEKPDDVYLDESKRMLRANPRERAKAEDIITRHGRGVADAEVSAVLEFQKRNGIASFEDAAYAFVRQQAAPKPPAEPLQPSEAIYRKHEANIFGPARGQLGSELLASLRGAEERIAGMVPEGPERERALKRWGEFADRALSRIADLPAPERADALARFMIAGDYLLTRAAENPARTKAWLDFIADNPNAVEYAMLAKRGLDIRAQDIVVAEIRPSIHDMSDRKALKKALGKRVSFMEDVIREIPERWFMEAGVRRDYMMDLAGSDPLRAAAELDRVTMPHGISVVRKATGVYLAEVSHTFSLHGQPDIRGLVITGAYGTGDMFDGMTAYFNPLSGRIFMRGTAHFAEAGIPESALPGMKMTYVHEMQHLLDNAGGYVAALSARSAGRGMAFMPEYRARLETTAVAREVLEMVPRLGGRGTEDAINAAIRKDPEEYKQAYRKALDAMRTGEDGRPDPDWAGRPPEVLQNRLRKLIDDEYRSLMPLSYTELYGPTTAGIVRGEITVRKPAAPEAVPFKPAVAADSAPGRGEPDLLRSAKYENGILTIEADYLGGELAHAVKPQFAESAVNGEFIPSGDRTKPSGLWLSWGSGWDYFTGSNPGLMFKGTVKFRAEMRSGLKLFLLDGRESFDSMMAEFRREVKVAETTGSGYPDGTWPDNNWVYYEKSPWQWLRERGYDGVAVTEEGYLDTNFQFGWDAASIVIFEPAGNVRLPGGEARLEEYRKGAQGSADAMLPLIEEAGLPLFGPNKAYDLIEAYAGGRAERSPGKRIDAEDEAFLKKLLDEKPGLEEAAKRIIEYVRKREGG